MPLTRLCWVLLFACGTTAPSEPAETRAPEPAAVGPAAVDAAPGTPPAPLDAAAPLERAPDAIEAPVGRPPDPVAVAPTPEPEVKGVSLVFQQGGPADEDAPLGPDELPVAPPATPSVEPPSPPPPAGQTDEPVVPAIATGPRTYVAQPARSRLYVVVRDEPGLIAGAFVDTRVVAATRFTGTIEWGPNLEDCRVAIEVPVDALDVDPGDSRSWENLNGDTNEGAREQIREVIWSDEQLDLARFPTITYRSTRCDRRQDFIDVTGELTIHGRSLVVIVPMRVEYDEASFRARGRFRANHSHFGIRPYRALMGALRHREELEFVVDVRGTAQ